MADKKISALTGATTPLAGTEVLPIVQSGSTVKVAVSDLTAGRDFSAKRQVLGTVSLANWSTSYNVLQVGLNSAFYGHNGIGLTGMADNSYADVSDEKYITTAPAAQYSQFQNTHRWYVAPSGTAGTTIPWVQALGIDASANVTVNTGNLIQGTAAKGVNFTANTPAAGMTSQLLNWYEEGNWTPVLTFGGASVGMGGGYSGKYTRVGRLLHFVCNVQLTAKGSSTGVAAISGLPFASNITSAHSLYSQDLTYVGMLSFQTDATASSINLRQIAITGAASNLSDVNFANTTLLVITGSYPI